MSRAIQGYFVMKSALLVHSDDVYLYSSECSVTTFWWSHKFIPQKPHQTPGQRCRRLLSYWWVSGNPRTLVDHKLADY